MNILLVEDDASSAIVITAALEAEGLTVTHCDSIAERNRLLAQSTYAALLTDVMLADGDGIESLGVVHEWQRPLTAGGLWRQVTHLQLAASTWAWPASPRYPSARPTAPAPIAPTPTTSSSGKAMARPTKPPRRAPPPPAEAAASEAVVAVVAVVQPPTGKMDRFFRGQLAENFDMRATWS